MIALPASFRRPSRIFAIVTLALILCAAIIGAFITPYDPIALNIHTRLIAPNAAYWFGSDQFGRDLLSRMLVGAGVSIRVSLLTVCAASIAGIALGSAAGYFGGLLDRIISGFSDGLLALPSILLALSLIAVLGASETGNIAALGIAFTPYIARIVRGLVVSARARPFVEVAQNFKHPSSYIIARHIVPNIFGPIIVLASHTFALALLAESALSFLGLGVPPPYPSWGGILADGQRFMSDAPWLVLFPGAAIILTLLCINLIGDGLRDHFDPRNA